MPAETQFARRLELAISGESVHAFSKRAGIPDSTVRKYLAGTMPGLDNLIAMATAADVTLDWLAAERGPMRISGSLIVGGEVPDGFVPVPKLDIRPSAGPGSLTVYEEGEPDILAFRENWLRRIGVNPKSARLMIAKGDSMRETVDDGDLMIVDVSIREVVNGAIHVLVYNGMVILKRLQILRNGVLLLKSDNPKYDTEEVPLNEQPELIIEGRVLWAGGMI
ncbi:MAG: helix-turn-helix transcriptional regulator [Rhizobiaceae bacterium]|nr:helix-turn-helix transcriptional regulator [Rhizobiaceae bacterium]